MTKNKPQVTRVFIFRTFAGNRIAVKIIRLLQVSEFYKVKKRTQGNTNVYEISVLSTTNATEELKKLYDEIINLIRFNFKRNYLFCVGSLEMGYTYSFSLCDGNNCTKFSHKIKEVKPSTIIPGKQITYY